MDFQSDLRTKIIEKSKKKNRASMLLILIVLFVFFAGIAVGSTYSGFQSTAESNGALTFAVNGHQGDFSFSHSKISHYNSTDLELEFTLVGDENYNTPTVSITMGGTPLTQDGNDFKSGTIIIATYSVGVLTINRANVIGNLSIIATSTINTYTVTYNATTNGGTTSATAVSVNHGSNADLTKIASKTDWTFVGWNTSSTATTALSSCTITANTTLYAIFSRTLTIYYNNNGATGSVAATIYNTATSGTSTTNLPAIASRSGWTIYGWANSTTASSTRVDNTTTAHVISITTTTTGSTYYATYTRTLTLSYNANGGSSTPSSQTTTQYYNSAGNTSSHSFTLANAIAKTQDAQYTYSFNSWTQGSTSGTSYNAGASVSINADTTFYAKWNNTIRSYTVTYNAATNGGSTTANSVNVNYGNSADLTKTASKSGWTFVGWNTSSSATSALGSYTVTSNVTLYAIFSRTLTMNYNNNGSISSVSTVIYNNATSGTSSTNLPAVANISGWSAYGWGTSIAADNTRVDSTTTAHAITITTSTTGGTYYAKYSRTLTLSYNANGGSSTPSSQTTTQYHNSAGGTSSHSFTLAGAIAKTADVQYTYSFKCWTQGSTGGTERDASTSVTLSENTTFYAKWNSAIRYYTIYIYESPTPHTFSYAYGTVLKIVVAGPVGGGVWEYEFRDGNNNIIKDEIFAVGCCYLDGVQVIGSINGAPAVYSATFTVTDNHSITFYGYAQ